MRARIVLLEGVDGGFLTLLLGRLCQEQSHASRPSLVEETAAVLHASFSFGLHDTVTLGSASMTP